MITSRITVIFYNQITSQINHHFAPTVPVIQAGKIFETPTPNFPFALISTFPFPHHVSLPTLLNQHPIGLSISPRTDPDFQNSAFFRFCLNFDHTPSDTLFIPYPPCYMASGVGVTWRYSGVPILCCLIFWTHRPEGITTSECRKSQPGFRSEQRDNPAPPANPILTHQSCPLGGLETVSSSTKFPYRGSLANAWPILANSRFLYLPKQSC